VRALRLRRLFESGFGRTADPRNAVSKKTVSRTADQARLALRTKQMPYHLVDGGILLSLVPFGIFFAVPIAQCLDTIVPPCLRRELSHFKIGSTLSLMMLASSHAFSDFSVTSTVRVNMETLPLRLF
jgi:hypothetical protein